MKRDDLVSLEAPAISVREHTARSWPHAGLLWLQAVSVGAPLLGGQLMGLISYKGVQGWYHRLKKPRWTPPKWLFAAAWPVLYVGQGVSSWLVWKDKSIKGNKKNIPLALYGAQLILNLLWQPLMFKLHRPDLALVDSSLMLGVATAATASMATAVKGAGNKATVASCMGVYVGWLAFATALNARIYKDNPDADKIDDTPLPPAEQVKSLKAQ